MSKISILPDLLINKIAAGEVIERPAAVIRELIDNSIDAGATEIEIEILHGGKKLMKVSDNGSGMNKDDASLCFERHATSKLSSEDDLFSISTLGFRGEALPAIASVSKVTLATSTKNSDTGIKIEIGVNRKKEVADASPLQGTTVEIRDIFYNTPARRKFLKSIPTELSHIIGTVIQKAFAYPETAFSLIHNKSEVLNAPPAAGLKERFIQLYSEEMANEFLEVNTSTSPLPHSFYGFTSKENFTRASRSHQLIFVNKRPVKNPTVNHAVYSAYSGLIPKERHPAYFLFLDIDPKKVDVNVHPAKREVRFEAPDEIHRLVESAIYNALHPSTYPHAYKDKAASECAYQLNNIPAVRESAAEFFGESQTDFFTSGVTSDIRSYFHIGEAFIATITNNGLLIIDQHAAHERILYEKFLKKLSIEAEALFLPLRVELSAKEYNILIKHKEFLHGIGLEIEEFGGKNIIVRAMPKELHKADMKGLLMDIASGILEEETTGIKGEIGKENLLQNIAARLACHKSVRGKESLNNEEIARMMTDLDKCEEHEKCPHGRPTRILLSLDELKKMFKRK